MTGKHAHSACNAPRKEVPRIKKNTVCNLSPSPRYRRRKSLLGNTGNVKGKEQCFAKGEAPPLIWKGKRKRISGKGEKARKRRSYSPFGGKTK